MSKVRATDGDASSGGVAATAMFELAYGRVPDDAELAQLSGLFPAGHLDSVSELHRLLASFDAQSHPTPLVVRSGRENLRRRALDGFALWLDSDDGSVSAVIADRGVWEPHVTDVLRSTLRPGATFVDVGANVGYHTFLAASLVGANGRVVAVEPSSENCRLLQLAKLDNDFSNVTILPVALDRTTGVRYLSSHLGTNGGLVRDTQEALLNGYGTTVLALTLDDIAPDKVDVLKIDVEGAEFRVLDGSRKVLERDRPVILMEFSYEMSSRVSEVDPCEALNDLLALGYRLSLLDQATNQRVHVRSAEALLDDWGDPLRVEDLLLEPA
jgi:FkbM family methyltransferase